jgi:CRISPR-associated protein (Cas_Cas02710)
VPGSLGPSILAEELAVVRRRAQERLAGESPPDLLILCVGYSPEPLLLAIAHHAPVAIVLLIADGLDAAYLESLEKLWDEHHDLLGVPAFASLEQRTVRDTAADVFLQVRDIVENRRRTPPARIVVDITGAKKSMVAGAFLAAGFLDLESGYVDFGEYDITLRRPVPGTSEPGSLQHPDHLFRLREEARLAEEVDRRRFREAERLADGLAELASSGDVRQAVGDEEAQGWARRFAVVRRVAAAYARWSEGFYAETAEEIATCPGLQMPPTVAQLAPIWPRADASPKEIVDALREEHVFADPSTALAYFLDVLVWNGELRIREYPRDAFLRLYGTIESVIFWAFDIFVGRHSDRLRIEPQEPGELSTEERTELLDRALGICRRSSTNALKVLRGAPGLAASPELPCTVSLDSPAIAKDVFSRLFKGQGGRQKLASFTDLRHKAVHWLAPVPWETALDLLRYYRTVLGELIPLITAHLRAEPALDVAARERLDSWERRLLAAAQGRIPEDCEPLPYRRIETGVIPA